MKSEKDEVHTRRRQTECFIRNLNSKKRNLGNRRSLWMVKIQETHKLVLN